MGSECSSHVGAEAVDTSNGLPSVENGYEDHQDINYIRQQPIPSFTRMFLFDKAFRQSGEDPFHQPAHVFQNQFNNSTIGSTIGGGPRQREHRNTITNNI